MTIKMLYKYERSDGGVTVSTEKPDVEYIEIYRVVADEEKLITNNSTTTSCIDVSDTTGWYEIDYFKQEETDESELASDEISAQEFMALVEEAL